MVKIKATYCRDSLLFYNCSGIKISIFLVFFLLPLFSLLSSARVISVPKDYPTIQAAINAAADGDEIIVSPGTYYGSINFGGKNIILRSTDPMNPAVLNTTIIDGRRTVRAVSFSGTELTTCVLSGFTITNGYAVKGGGILGNGTKATIQYNIIRANTAHGSWPNGGGGLAECDGAIQDNTITGNSANDGGGLWDCDGSIQNNTITENSANDGGGLWDCDGTIQNNTVEHNLAQANGGGLAECNGVIQNNSISGNSAERGGGLVHCDKLIQNNTIRGNCAWGYGGGLYYSDGIIRNNTIWANSAGMCGGGFDNCDGIIQKNTISGNVAGYGGGGLAGCDGTIQNNVIYGNSAQFNGGGLHKCDGTIQNNTITGNSAQAKTGGLFWCEGSIRNCIIWQNTAPTSAQLYNCTIPSYSCIQEWTGGGTGNISADPRLAEPAKGNFHLLSNSPCIDAGCYIDGLTQDFEGNPRGYNGSPKARGDGSDFDIGADEYLPPKSTNK